MDNQNMTYPELRDLFVERNKTQLAKPVSACIVFAESNWPDRHYPLRSRTYEVSSDNKAFRSSCCSTSLFGSCLDGTDQMVRLDWYMKDFGNKGGWVGNERRVILENELFYICVEDNEWSLAVELVQKDGYSDCQSAWLAGLQKRRYREYLDSMKKALLARLPSIGVRTGPWTHGTITREEAGVC